MNNTVQFNTSTNQYELISDKSAADFVQILQDVNEPDNITLKALGDLARDSTKKTKTKNKKKALIFFPK